VIDFSTLKYDGEYSDFLSTIIEPEVAHSISVVKERVRASSYKETKRRLQTDPVPTQSFSDNAISIDVANDIYSDYASPASLVETLTPNKLNFWFSKYTGIVPSYVSVAYVVPNHEPAWT
jgi:hypothetical protein